MAITGRFEADFASFYEACRLSQVSLKGFENSSKDVERQVNEMVDSFSGRRVVTEATLMADAVGKIGGPSRLTQQELRRVGQVADEAIEKMNRWGEAPPRNLLRVAEASRSARSGLSAMAGEIRQVDNVLDVLGIHLGPARKAIDDLGFAAENGASGLGIVAKGGLALGASIAGWQIGRAISEFAGLDEKIGNVAASLLGLPSIAEQSALATADAIARAQKANPHLKVLTGETAQQLNALEAQARVKANTEASNIADRVEAVKRVAAEIKKVNDEVEAVRQSGVWPELTKQINSNAISMSDLAKQYHIGDEAMNILAKDAARVLAIEENNQKKLAELREALHKSDVDRVQKKIEAEKAALAALYENIDAQTKANEAAHQKDIELADAQIAARQRVEETTAALREQEEAARKAAEAIVSTRDYDLSTPGGLADFKRLNPTATVSSAANEEYFKTHSLAEAVRDGLIQFNATLGGRSQLFQPPPPPPGGQGGAQGGAQGSGGFGPRGSAGAGAPTSGAGAGGGYGAGFGTGGAPLPPLPSAGASEAGFRARPGGITQIYAPVIVSGVFDPSSAHALKTTIGDGFYKSLLQARKVPA